MLSGPLSFRLSHITALLPVSDVQCIFLRVIH